MRYLKYLFLLLPFASFAQVSPTSGVQFPGPVIRNAPTDGFPTQYNDLGNGGFHTGTSYHGRDSLSSATNVPNYRRLLRPGMKYRVYIKSVVDSTYTWSGTGWDYDPNGQTYTASHGNKLVGLDIQNDTTYADTVHSLFSRNGVNTNGLMVTGANQTILTKNNGSAGSALNVVTVASSISDILNFGVQNVTGDNKNYHIIAAPLPTSSGFNSDYNFTMPGASGGLFTTQDLDGNILPAYLTQLRLAAPTTVTGTQYSLVRDSITGVVKQSKVTGGGGSVTSVSSANTDIGVANPGTTPVLTLNSGSGANQIPKRNGSGNLSIGIADLTATGTPSITTYLRGDNTWATAASPVTFAIRETPSGSINSSNTTFTLAHTPTSGTELVFRNGMLQVLSTDYTISGGTITYLYAPTTGDVLRINYNY